MNRFLSRLRRWRGSLHAVLAFAYVAAPAIAAAETIEVTNCFPVIPALSNLIVQPGASPAVVPFTIGDDESNANDLVIAVQSSNPAVVEESGIVSGGGGSNRNLTITPRPGTYGETTITVSVRDGEGAEASQSFVFDVDPFSAEWQSFPVSQIAVATWADYDNDGDMDFLLTGINPTNSSGSRIYVNDGTGSFTAALSLPGSSYGPMAWGDYNNDGDLDLYLAANAGATLYANTGAGNLTYVMALAGGSSASWGDVDNDGRPDLVLARSGPEIYRSVAHSVTLWTNLPNYFSSAVYLADLDRDSQLDLLAGSNVLRNVAGEFACETSGLPQATPIALGDYDQDGFLDVLLMRYDGVSSETLLYRNNQDGTFSDSGAALPGMGAATAAWGDFDNDGRPDLVISGAPYPNTNRTTLLFRNNPDGTFTDVQANLPGVSSGSLVWGDCDNDGDLDLLVTGSTNGGYYGGIARLFRNETTRVNTPPVPPSNLVATLLPDNAVSLSWSAGSDAETTNGGGLTYALSAGFATNETWLVSPEADSVSGYRLRPASGVIGDNREWLLRDVPRGDYVWRVQAIDASYAGSAFSAQGTYSITNARPKIASIPDQRSTTNRTILPLQGVTNISISVSDFETPAADLVVTAYSSDTDAIPNANLVLGGSGTNRTLTILPSSRWVGPVVITVVVTDPEGLTATSSFITAPELFTQVVTLPMLRNSSLSWGDFNHDAALDLVLMGQANTGSVAHVYLNGGGAGFTNAAANLPQFARGAFAGDFNNDGNLDILLESSGGSSAVALNASNGVSFTLQVWPGPGFPASGLDVDGDGDLDISGGTYVLENRRSEGFRAFAAQQLPALDLTWAMVWGDYDRDGDSDVLVNGVTGGSGIVRIYRNDGAAGFTDIQAPLPGLSLAAAAWGDLDNDGDLDLALAGQAGQIWSGLNAARVFRNDGSDVFTDIQAGFVGVAWPSIAWADIDNDGYLDLSIAGSLGNGTSSNKGVTKVYRNNGDGTFTDTEADIIGVFNGEIGWADFDNDGDLDLAVTGRDDYESPPTVIYRNNWPLANTPPQPPANPATEMTNRTVTLSWSHGADAETAPAGLSYNVVVSSDSGMLVPPHADLVSGFRSIAGRGNAGGTSLTLRDLPAGAYTWSVQTIDTSYSGSPFMSGGTFVVTNRPPVVTNGGATVAEDAQVWVTLPAYDPDQSPLTFTIVKQPDHGTVGTVFVGDGGGYTVYRPGSNYFGADSFSFTAHDGTWNSAEATINITITPVQDRAETQLRLSRASGGIEFHLQGEPYQRMRIEVSTDLQTWTELQNLQASADGTITFSRATTGAGQEFYRSAIIE